MGFVFLVTWSLGRMQRDWEITETVTDTVFLCFSSVFPLRGLGKTQTQSPFSTDDLTGSMEVENTYPLYASLARATGGMTTQPQHTAGEHHELLVIKSNI